jgi:hypothetical protein
MQAYAKRNKERQKYTERDYVLDIDGNPHAMHAFYLETAKSDRIMFGNSNTYLRRRIFRKKFEERLIAAYSWRQDDLQFSFGC